MQKDLQELRIAGFADKVIVYLILKLMQNKIVFHSVLVPGQNNI
jgi:hypothetical protein